MAKLERMTVMGKETKAKSRLHWKERNRVRKMERKEGTKSGRGNRTNRRKQGEKQGLRGVT